MTWLLIALAIRQRKRSRARRHTGARYTTQPLMNPAQVIARFPYGQVPPPPPARDRGHR